MTFDYTTSKSTAERLIARFGQNATLRRLESVGPQWAPKQYPTDTTIKAVDLDILKRDRDGSLTAESSRNLLISTSAGIVPRQDYKIVIGLAASAVTDESDWHEIENVKPLSPGGTDILYEAALKT